MVRLRRALSAALAALLLCMNGLPARAAGALLAVNVPQTDVLASPDPAADRVGEAYAGMLLAPGEERNGFYKVTLPETGVTGWVRASAFAAEPTADIASIYIRTLPERLTYTEDESVFDSTGLSVWARYADGREAPLGSWTLLAPPLDSPGEKTVTVTAGGGPNAPKTSFSVTVTKAPLKAMKLTSAPKQTAYIERQTPSLSGLAVTVSYTDGRPDRVFTAEEILGDADFTFVCSDGKAPDAPMETGERVVTLRCKYDEIACSFRFTARARTLTDLLIATPPDSAVVYSKTEVPALTGLTLTALYDNGETETLTPADCAVLCDPGSFVLGDGNPVTLLYGGKSVTLTLRLAQEIQTGVAVKTPEVLAFIMGEKIDLSGLKVYKVYASGRREETEDYTLSRIDPEMSGAQTLTVRSGEFSAAFTIYIQEFYRRGDVTGDGRVTAADARLILRAAVGLVTFGKKLSASADTDRDGRITAADARIALRAAVGLETIPSEGE